MKYRSVTSKRQMCIFICIYIYMNARPLLLKVSVLLDCTSQKMGPAGGGAYIYIYALNLSIYVYIYTLYIYALFIYIHTRISVCVVLGGAFPSLQAGQTLDNISAQPSTSKRCSSARLAMLLTLFVVLLCFPIPKIATLCALLWHWTSGAGGRVLTTGQPSVNRLNASTGTYGA